MKKISKNIKLISYILISLIIFIINSCSLDDPSIMTEDDKKNLVFAIGIKANECGGGPGIVIFPIDDKVKKYSMQACTLAILQQDCPFTTYPLICIEIYKTDYPNAGPKL